MMTPERWLVLEPLIEEALNLKPEHRRAFYDRVLSSDRVLGAELEDLVVRCERNALLINSSAAERFALLFDDDSKSSDTEQSAHTNRRGHRYAGIHGARASDG